MGHYDAAIATHKIGKLPMSCASGCSCGINKKSRDSLSCQPTAFYSTRYKCFKQSQPCSSHCHCIGCANPFDGNYLNQMLVKEDDRSMCCKLGSQTPPFLSH